MAHLGRVIEFHTMGRALTVALAIITLGGTVRSLRAQDTATNATRDPTRRPVLVDVQQDPMSPPLFAFCGVCVRALALEPPFRLASAGTVPIDLRARRRKFAGVGALVGGVAATVWTFRSTRDAPLGHAAAVMVLPISLLGGMAVGGVTGYLISFVVYPPSRTG